MKKLFSFIVSFIIIISSFSISALADELKKISVLDPKGKEIQSYALDLEADSFDHYVRAATKYIRNLKSNEIYTVKIPKGNYDLEDAIEVYSNTIVDFGNSKMTKTGHIVMLKIGVIPGYDFDSKKYTTYYNGYDCVQNVTVMNGTFDGNNDAFSTSSTEDEKSLVKFSHAQNITMQNITLQNTKNVHHQLTFAASKNVKIDKCSFLNMDIGTITNNCEAIQIDILDEYFFVNAKNYDGTTTSNVSIENCKFNNVHRGIGTHSGIAGYYFDNMKIKNNVFQNIDGYAVKVTNYRNSEISNNTITNCGSGIMAGNMANRNLSNFLAPVNASAKIIAKCNLTIENNKMSIIDTKYPTTAFGVDILGTVVKKQKDKNGNVYSGDFRVSDVEIRNNTIVSSVVKNHFTGIRLEGVYGSQNSKNSDFLVKNNTIQINTSAKSSKDIYGVTIKNGSNICCFGNTIFDNIANNALKNGFYAMSGSNYTITENKVYNIKNSGMRFSSSNNIFVTNNTVLNTFGQGMYFSSSSKNIYANKNYISNVADDGISIDNASANEIKDNTISKARANGIDISSISKVTLIRNNNISSPSLNGIVVKQSANVKSIYYNTVKTAGKNGILADEKAIVDSIYKNQINSSNNVAINITKNASVRSIKSNTISSPKSYAIALTSSAKAVKIVSNTIDKAGKSGVYLSGSASTNYIKSNTITNTTGYAVLLAKNAFAKYITQNNISNPGNSAIHLKSKASSANINKNIIDITKSNAISLNNSASAKKINENIINYKKSKNSKKLKVSCSNGIYINSLTGGIKQITSNKIKNCKQSGIAVLSASSKVGIKENVIKGCKIGVKYTVNNASLSNNKITKAQKLKYKSVTVKTA